MKKAKILVLLTLAMALVLVAACNRGNDGGGTGTNVGTNVTTGDAGAAADNDAAADPGEAAAPVRELPPLSTEPITLTFSTWHYFELAQAVGEAFTERHPNITIEIVEIPGTHYYMDTLLSMAAAQNFPDMFGFLNLAVPINNGWFLDFSEYWFDDPDSYMLLDSLHYHVLIDGRAMRFPEAVLPQLVYLDRNVFELLNEPMPPFNWVWEDMLELIPRMTRPDMGIFGYNMFLGPVTWAPVVLNDAISEFGWDGENYNMQQWAQYLNQQIEWERLGYRAMSGNDEWEALTGDRYMWPGVSGRVAMQMDAIWTFNNLYVRDHYRERGIDMVPYAIPMGRNARTNRRPAFVDFAGISSATAHPREAYEALKWMTFHTDAWHVRNQITPLLENAAGNRIFYTPNRFPLTNDPQVWSDFRNLFPLDEPAWDYLLNASHEPVPLGGQGILGFAEWHHAEHVNGDFNGVIGVGNAVAQGVIDAFDVVQRMEETGRAAHEAAVNNFRIMFGQPPKR
ncbi:MAG: extracellular solute-binding protein [Firmicutes bacterium]|nr:extracellular solute-binding protein [Bacillota bacterium]